MWRRRSSLSEVTAAVPEWSPAPRRAVVGGFRWQACRGGMLAPCHFLFLQSSQETCALYCAFASHKCRARYPLTLVRKSAAQVYLFIAAHTVPQGQGGFTKLGAGCYCILRTAHAPSKEGQASSSSDSRIMWLAQHHKCFPLK